MPEIGKPFNPWSKACGFYPPDKVARLRTYNDGERDREFTDGMKRLYERGVRWAGRNGSFWYSFETMADELGKSRRQVQYDMAALEKAGFISHKRRGFKKSNIYEFLWNEAFESDAQSTANHSGGDAQPAADYPPSDAQDSPSDAQWTVEKPGGDAQSTAHEFSPVLQLSKGISSSNVHHDLVEQPEPEASHDDETPVFFDSKTEHQNPEPSMEVAIRREFEETPIDIEAQIDEARRYLRVTRVKALDLDGRFTDEGARAIQKPDQQITTEILECFPDFECFERWVEGTVHRRVAQKATSPTWGIYRTDAKNHAPTIIEAVRRERANDLDAAIALEREVEARQKHVRLMDTATDPAGAIAEAEKQRKKTIPEHLRMRLLRRGEFISPNAVLELCKTLAQCPSCTKGVTGNAIDRTLSYCRYCTWGEELGYANPGWPECEIERVHATTKALLVAACLELSMPFTSDAIDLATIVEDGEAVVIVPRPIDRFSIHPNDLPKIAARLGWTRDIRLVRPSADGNPNPQSYPMQMASVGSAAQAWCA